MTGGAVSATARAVAAYRLNFERPTFPPGDPISDDRLARDVAGGETVHTGSRMAVYLAERTAFFDRVVLNSLERGIVQVVIAGAGYDGRALRFAMPGVRWFEMDQLATQTDKRNRLHRLAIPAASVHFVPADFRRDDVSKSLVESGFLTTSPALFICEGVAVYLERVVLERLLQRLGSVAASGSELAISCSVAGEKRGRRRKFDRRVAALGEPALTHLSAGELEGVLEGAGWKVHPAFHQGGAYTRARRVGFVVAARDG